MEPESSPETFTFRVSEDARSETLTTERRLESEEPGFGRDFIQLFEEAAREITAHPRMFPRTEDGPDGTETREYFIRRFEYRVIYFFPLPPIVEVIAVLHARRRPGVWVWRLPPTS